MLSVPWVGPGGRASRVPPHGMLGAWLLTQVLVLTAEGPFCL